jgi:DnaK suppressor protein
MASKTPLTEDQLAEITNILLERKRAIEEELRRNLSRVLEEGGEDTTVVNVEEGGESRVDVGKEMDFQVMSMRTQELRQINEALMRIEMREYGLCEECGSPIRFERLRVMPFAQLCRSCQEELEKEEKERQLALRPAPKE